MFTKSGIMVGLGEERNEVLQVMDDLRSADVDFLTIGQYLQPTRKHHAVMRFVTPDEFKAYETVAYAKGFLMVSASPLTRSSHHAGEDFARAEGRARGRLAADRNAEVFQQTPVMHARSGDVRSGRRRRALSGIRAAVPALKLPAHAEARRHRYHRRRHDGRRSSWSGDLHQPGDARPRQPEIMVEYLDGPFSAWKTAGLQAAARGRRARSVLPRLRIQEPDAGDADGHDVRYRVPARFGASVRTRD